MASSAGETMVREAVGVFDDADTLQAAADELMSSGFDHAYLSLVASDAAIDRKLGHTYRKVREVEDEPDVPRTAYITTESRGDAKGAIFGALMYVPAVAVTGAIVASGGTLAAAIAAAALSGGGGALLGTIASAWFDQHHADYLQEQLDRGGLLLWVRTPDAEHEKRAVEILGRHSAHDVHVHGLPG